MTTKKSAKTKTARPDPVASAVAARKQALAAKETPSPSKGEAIEPKEAAPPKRKTVNVSLETLAKAMAIKEKVTIQLDEVFKPAIHPKAVMDAVGNKSMAMDENITSIVSWAANMEGSSALEGTQFLGYAHLAQMSQRAEYRRPVEILANEMTRKWIKITSTSDGKDQQGEGDDRNTKVKQIEAEFKKFKVKDKFRKALEHDGFFGRGHIYVDVAPENADKSELDKSIGNGTNSMTMLKVTKGSLRGFRVVEPVWCYPLGYNTSDPLHPDWYEPSEWMVQGRTIHTTRLITIVGREVSDLLKPAYSFGGLSLTQMLKPYVDNWLRTRQSVSDLVNKFSVSGVKMNLGDLLGVNDEQIFRRVKFYNAVKSNSGMMLLDKDTEEYFQVSTPLGGLESLQAQSQEHMASVSGVPLVKLFGIQPTGLNATSDGELECFYTWVHSLQESMIDDPIRFILNLVQLHLYGEIDPGIDFEFVNLDALTEEEEEELNSKKATTDKTLIEAGVLDKSESRKRVASDPNSPYASLDANKLPVAAVNEADKAGATAQEVGAIATIFDTGLLSEKSALAMFDGVGQRTGVFRIPAQDIANASDEPPEPEIEGDLPPGMEGEAAAPGEEDDDGGDPPAPDQNEAQDSAGGVKSASPIVRLAQVMRRRKARIAQQPVAQDADWDESKHERADNGQFGAGGGGSSKTASVKQALSGFSDPKAVDQMSYEDNKALAKELHQAYNTNEDFRKTVGILDRYLYDQRVSLATRKIVEEASKGKPYDQIIKDPKIKELWDHTKGYQVNDPLPEDKVREIVENTPAYFKTLKEAPETQNETYRGCKPLKVQVGKILELRGPTAFSADKDSAMTYSGGMLIRVEPGAKMLPSRAMVGSAGNDEHSTVPAFWSRSESKVHPKGVGYGFSIGMDTDRELTSSGKFEVLSVEKQEVKYKDSLSGKTKTRTVNVAVVKQVGLYGDKGS